VTTVIDVGCARYGGDYSLERLIEMYEPSTVYGFDPAWAAEMFDPPADLQAMVTVSNEAAWTYDGTVRFMADGLNSQVGNHEHWAEVPCIDLARFIGELPDGPIILKLDAEGAEYNLLDDLIARDIDSRLQLVVVEWHERPAWEARRARIERRLACPLEEWRW
jgi:FkbM family methyltransferase